MKTEANVVTPSTRWLEKYHLTAFWVCYPPLVRTATSWCITVRTFFTRYRKCLHGRPLPQLKPMRSYMHYIEALAFVGTVTKCQRKKQSEQKVPSRTILRSKLAAIAIAASKEALLQPSRVFTCSNKRPRWRYGDRTDLHIMTSQELLFMRIGNRSLAGGKQCWS